MEIYIVGLNFRAVTPKLCDFLSDSGAVMVTSKKDSSIDIMIKSHCFCVDFESDEREEITIKVIARGKKLAYTFDSADIDKVAFM